MTGCAHVIKHWLCCIFGQENLKQSCATHSIPRLKCPGSCAVQHCEHRNYKPQTATNITTNVVSGGVEVSRFRVFMFLIWGIHARGYYCHYQRGEWKRFRGFEVSTCFHVPNLGHTCPRLLLSLPTWCMVRVK